MSGILATLFLQGMRTLSSDVVPLHAAFHGAFQDLQQEAERHNVDVRFRVRPHPLHGDSGTVREALDRALQNGLTITDAPFFLEIHLMMSEDTARELLAGLPGSTQMYSELAKKFREIY